ncbi:MAG: selenide, water dikinase SelD, partial [Pseudorhodobacter sp.]|nr:selenide, water dikinase SelD [Pseudorhodobacter sp.]
NVTIIGGGVGGVELALASAHRLRATGRVPHVTVLQKGTDPLPGLTPSARKALLKTLTKANITLRLNADALHATATEVTLQNETLPSDFTLTVAGARPHPWLTETGLTLHDGFVAVTPTLQTSDPLIFATGDCAHLTHAPRPKAGVFAVRAAPVLLHNLRAALTETPMQQFHPQADYLKLISLGSKRALATKWGLHTSGSAQWRLKDRIDRDFMAKFTTYPAMPQPTPATPTIPALTEALPDKPLCGGCGAKVGPARLAASLTTLPRPTRSDVIAGAGDDAAQLRHGAETQVITTDHLRSFTADPRLMARITAVHALGDIWAMGAQPQAALSQITLPRLSPDLQSRMLAEILDEAAKVFAEAGADIVGGHTSIGSELTIGFTVTGLCRRPITKAGAVPGDAILLTKALGSGTVMAAEMAMAQLPGPLILGEAVAAALTAMSHPQGPAAASLSTHARAMTDVTGFGLLGHLMEILQASQCAATLLAVDIPYLPGAEALAAAGVASSIAPANRSALAGQVTGPASPLLYDPQTGGGLLAIVPAHLTNFLLTKLRATDPDTALIGHITAGLPHITVT